MQYSLTVEISVVMTEGALWRCAWRLIQGPLTSCPGLACYEAVGGMWKLADYFRLFLSVFVFLLFAPTWAYIAFIVLNQPLMRSSHNTLHLCCYDIDLVGNVGCSVSLDLFVVLIIIQTSSSGSFMRSIDVELLLISYHCYRQRRHVLLMSSLGCKLTVVGPMRPC